MGTLKQNWAGNVKFTHAKVEYPSTESEIQKMVYRAATEKKKIRVIGSGHSFTQLCATKYVLMSLDNYQGLVSVQRDKHIATVKGGTKLSILGEILHKEGLAMENMGDIDAQSIAGTISTGTHGTGTAFGTISTQVIAIKFINGKGEIISCSNQNNPELFKAIQVSLGALGIITEITIQCIPSYKLLIDNKKEKLADVLETLEHRKAIHRNFEYYWIPHTDTAWTKTTNIIEEGEPERDTFLNKMSELIVENYLFLGFCELAKVIPSFNKTVAKITANSVPTMSKINYSHKVYATTRIVKFTEMEYNIPQESFKDAVKDMKKLISKNKYDVHFPIENRWVKKDDIMMSPAYGRDSAYIACHMYHKKDNTKYFRDLEEIFRSYGGRPHWGKQNTLNVNDVEKMYPMFPVFNKHRLEQDPNGVFMSPYLKNLIG